MRHSEILKPKPKYLLPVALACSLATTSCANHALQSAPPSDPPQVQVSAKAEEPCLVYTLPTDHRPTEEEKETGYRLRGLNVMECDIKRELGVSAHKLEHQKEADWRQARAERRCPWYRFGTCKAEPAITAQPNN